jgi:polysaccharide export outer membrane protein
VYAEENLAMTVRVDSRGDINLKMVGPVHVCGLTVATAEAVIEKAYRDGHYLLDPHVTLTVEELAPREVSVQGYFKNPGRYALGSETVTTLIDMIARAGGFQDTAWGARVKVTRVLPGGAIKVFEVDIDDVLKGKSRDKATIEKANMPLEPGDVIYVPERIL